MVFFKTILLIAQRLTLQNFLVKYLLMILIKLLLICDTYDIKNSQIGDSYKNIPKVKISSSVIGRCFSDLTITDWGSFCAPKGC